MFDAKIHFYVSSAFLSKLNLFNWNPEKYVQNFLI